MDMSTSGQRCGGVGIIDSKVVSSEQLADMYLMYKDHKLGHKTRPVVTGCNSNTRGFSNSVSDLLESVNKANQTPYEVISTEDKLARIEAYNKEAEKIMEEGREHLKRKVLCSKGTGGENIARCTRLWNKKSKAARRQASKDGEEDNMEDNLQGEGQHEEHQDHQDEDDAEEDARCCSEDPSEEMMKFRLHQYNNNPKMALSGEDAQLVLDCDHCGPELSDCV